MTAVVAPSGRTMQVDIGLGILSPSPDILILQKRDNIMPPKKSILIPAAPFFNVFCGLYVSVFYHEEFEDLVRIEEASPHPGLKLRVLSSQLVTSWHCESLPAAQEGSTSHLSMPSRLHSGVGRNLQYWPLMIVPSPSTPNSTPL